jgi:hypothetical protein
MMFSDHSQKCSLAVPDVILNNAVTKGSKLGNAGFRIGPAGGLRPAN